MGGQAESGIQSHDLTLILDLSPIPRQPATIPDCPKISGTDLTVPIGAAAALARVMGDISSCLRLVHQQSHICTECNTGMPPYLFQSK